MTDELNSKVCQITESKCPKHNYPLVYLRTNGCFWCTLCAKVVKWVWL